MRDRASEEASLAEADRHIEQAKHALRMQQHAVDQLVADGHDATQARLLLEAMQGTLAAFETHRAQIVQALADMDRDGRWNTCTPPTQLITCCPWDQLSKDELRA